MYILSLYFSLFRIFCSAYETVLLLVFVVNWTTDVPKERNEVLAVFFLNGSLADGGWGWWLYYERDGWKWGLSIAFHYICSSIFQRGNVFRRIECGPPVRNSGT